MKKIDLQVKICHNADMISEVVKHNWVQTALAHWDARYQAGEIPKNRKPNRQLLEGLIGLMFTQEKMLMGSLTWVDLSSVNTANFFEPKSRERILKRVGKSLSARTDIRKNAYECLQHVYEEGFEIEQALPRYTVSKTGPAQPAAAPAVKKQPPKKEKTLAEIWADAAYVVLKNDFKTPRKDLPKKAVIQSAVQNVLSELQKEFGEVSYQQFVDDDDVIDKTEEILNAQISNPETDVAKLVAEALKVSAAQLPPRP